MITLPLVTPSLILGLLGVGVIALLQTQKPTQTAKTAVAQNIPNTTTTTQNALYVPTVSTQNTADTDTTGDSLKPPETMAEWAKGANIIVQAQVVRVVRDGYSAGYDPKTGVHLWREAPKTATGVAGGPTPIPAAVYPVTDFEIKPVTVFRDDGHIASGKPLTLSVLGRLNSPDTDQTAMPQIGQTYLFVLNLNLDKETYGMPRACGQLIVGTTSLQCPGKGQQLLPFMKGQTPTQFFAQLQQLTAKGQ